MKSFTSAILAVCLLFSNSLSAQKNKKKKDNVSTDTTLVDLSKFTPPKIARDEEVKADERIEITDIPIDEKIAVIEASGSDGYGSGNYKKRPAHEKTVFDATGKYYLISDYTSSGYYPGYKYGIEDSSGKTILPTVFNEIMNIGSVTRLKLGQLYGLVDSNFKTILPMEYSNILKVKGTKWMIAYMTTTTSATRLIDNKGEQVVPGDFYSINEITQWNKAPNDTTQFLSFQIKDNKRALFSVAKKKFITDFVIKEARFVNDNNLIITDNTGTHLYNKNMVPITPETFDNIYTTQKNVLIVSKNKKSGLMTNTGKFILPCEYNVITQTGPTDLGCFIAGKNGKFICIDYLGKNLLGDIYDSIVPASYQSNNLIVTKAKKMGIKDLLNHTILPIEFDTIYTTAYASKYFTHKGNKSAFYSLTGDLLNEFDCDKIENLTYGYKVFYKNKKVGLMTTDFVKLSEPVYDKLELIGYSYGYSSSAPDNFRVIANNKYGVISKSSVVVPLIYDQLVKLNKAFLVRQNGKYGLIRSSDYKVIAPCNYDYISNDGSNDLNYIAIENGVSHIISLNQ